MVFIINMLIVFYGTPRNSENREEPKFLLWIQKTNVTVVGPHRRTYSRVVTGRVCFRWCKHVYGSESIIFIEDLELFSVTLQYLDI